jgi:hypothetical protein
VKINLFKSKSFFYLFIILSLFPWVQFTFKNTLGIQPYIAIYSLLLILLGLKYVSFNKHIFFFLIIVFIHFIFSGLNFEAIRSFLSYLSFCLVYIATSNFIKYSKEINISFILNFALLTYISVGLVQVYYDPDLFINLINKPFGYGQIAGRGVESLAAEPTFLGFHCLFILTFYFLYSTRNNQNNVNILKLFLKKNKIFIILIFLLLFYISRSPSAIFLFLILIFCYLFLSSKLIFFLTLILFFGGLEFFEPSDLRVLKFLQNLSNPELILFELSVWERILNIFISFYFGILNPLGNGYGELQNFFNEFWYLQPENYEISAVRISSFLGTIVLELGIFTFLYFLFFLIYNPIRKNLSGKKKVILLIFLILILIQSIPISYPLAAVTLSIINSYSNNSFNGSNNKAKTN